MPPRKWRKIHSRKLHQNPWFKTSQNKVVRPDGSTGDYFVVETHRPAVFIIAENSKNEILLIKLHRFTTKKVGWELPAGMMDPKETPLKAAKREFLEETGYRAHKWKQVGEFYSLNGIARDLAYVFVAQQLTYVDAGFHLEQEGISEVSFFSIARIKSLIQKKGIHCGQTIACLGLRYL